MENLKTQLAIFDFDGTLTTSGANWNCWRYIWEKIGKEERDDELYDQFLQGRFGPDEWTEKAIVEFRESGVTKEMLSEISQKIHLREGVKETFEWLKAHGIRIYIFSGGIKELIHQCLGPVKDLVDEIECDDLSFGQDGIVDGSIKASHDTTYKFHFVKELSESLKIEPEKIFFMGNGENDESVHKTGATTLCVNPTRTNPHDKNCWDFYIEDIQDLREIIPYIK